MLTTIEGIYRDGRVELSETPEGAEERPVLVTFLERNGANGPAKAQTGQMITFGMFSGPAETDEEDFRLAEFHGDSDDGLDWP